MDQAVVHFEIPADDPERATRFHRELFGWEIQKWASDGGPEYWMVSTVPSDAEGQPTRLGVNGGLMRRQHPGHQPVNYISVESVDDYAQKAKRLGAEEVMPKTPVKGMGWFAWLKARRATSSGSGRRTSKRPDQLTPARQSQIVRGSGARDVDREPARSTIERGEIGARIMGTIFGAVGFASTLGIALGPLAGGWLYDAFGSYAWLFIGSSGIGLGAVAIAFTFRPPRELPAALPSPSVAH